MDDVGSDPVAKILLQHNIKIYQFSRSVMSNSLRPHALQYARPPCPSPTARVYYPNPYPLSWWCHPTISSSVIPFSSCPQSFPTSGSFQMSQLFISRCQGIEVSASTSVLWTPRTDFLKDGLVWSPCSPRDSHESSPTPQFKSINSLVLSLIFFLFLFFFNFILFLNFT